LGEIVTKQKRKVSKKDISKAMEKIKNFNPEKVHVEKARAGDVEAAQDVLRYY